VSVPTNYILGPNDQVSVIVSDLADDFADKTFRIDMAGDLSLPVVGHIHAAGLTAPALEVSIQSRLGNILKNPSVTVSVAEFGSQAVSVLGSVNSPGIRQLEGRKTLFEVLSAAGGLRPDAGYLVNVTRDLRWGAIPLPNAKNDSTGTSSVASIKLKDIINATNPAENIIILPGDAVSVPKADLIYAIGSVNKPGGFILNEHESLSTLQVLSLADGLTKTAATGKAKILRAIPGATGRQQIAVDIKQIMSGKKEDVQLEPNDILFVPNSGARSASYRALDSIVAAATGIAIYSR
jgi:polysaccharide export outer membrane protein